MTGDSGALTWQVMQKFCAWHVAQLAATASGPEVEDPFAALPWPAITKSAASWERGFGNFSMSARVRLRAAVTGT
jgi:hypothetical protein